MKKIFKVLSCFLLILMISVPTFASETTQYVESQTSSTERNIFCKHTHVDIYKGAEVSRDCYKVGYNYVEKCVSCGKQLKGGTIYEDFSTPNHSFTTVTIACNKKTHTYETRCRKCSYSDSSFSVSCNGNCIEFESHEEHN